MKKATIGFLYTLLMSVLTSFDVWIIFSTHLYWALAFMFILFIGTMITLLIQAVENDRIQK